MVSVNVHYCRSHRSRMFACTYRLPLRPSEEPASQRRSYDVRGDCGSAQSRLHKGSIINTIKITVLAGRTLRSQVPPHPPGVRTHIHPHPFLYICSSTACGANNGQDRSVAQHLVGSMYLGWTVLDASVGMLCCASTMSQNVFM